MDEEAPPIRVAVVPVTALQQNCSVIRCEETGKGAFVDPGGDIERLESAAAELEVEIEKILVTHAHPDHAGAVKRLAAKLDVPIEGPHREDQPVLDNIATFGVMCGLAGCEVFEPTRWLEGGDTVTVGAQTLEVRFTPGHTPGHIVFVHRGAGLCFVGDVLFQGGVGRTDFPGGDFPTLERSIREQLYSLGDDVAFVPGHGPMSTMGVERRTNPFVRDA